MAKAGGEVQNRKAAIMRMDSLISKIKIGQAMSLQVGEQSGREVGHGNLS
jgi:hypothetical protein